MSPTGDCICTSRGRGISDIPARMDSWAKDSETLTKKEEETENSESEQPPPGNGIKKNPATLELYGRQADSIQEELRAWSELLSEREERINKKRSFLGRWRKSKGSRLGFLKRRKR